MGLQATPPARPGVLPRTHLFPWLALLVHSPLNTVAHPFVPHSGQVASPAASWRKSWFFDPEIPSASLPLAFKCTLPPAQACSVPSRQGGGGLSLAHVLIHRLLRGLALLDLLLLPVFVLSLLRHFVLLKPVLCQFHKPSQTAPCSSSLQPDFGKELCSLSLLPE